MHDRTAMTHKFAFSLDAELCRPSSQRPDAAHRLCLPFISSGVHQERRPVRRHWWWHHLRCEAGIVIFGNDAHIDRQPAWGALP